MDKMPNRKNTRIPEYDYSRPGSYFITICTHKRQNLFRSDGNNIAADMIVNLLNELCHKFSVSIDIYAIMPDHIHFILTITDGNTYTVPDMIQWFKAISTTKYTNAVKSGILPPFDKKIWQRSYYEHIIRNETDYAEIAKYISNNPLKYELEHGKRNGE